MSWKFWGKLETGERVYCGEGGHISVERDAVCLEKPTPEEKQEIYRTWPGLIEKPEKQKDNFPRICPGAITELKDRNKELVNDMQLTRSTIAALKYANAEKDKMIAGMIDDAVAWEREIDHLTMALKGEYSKKE